MKRIGFVLAATLALAACGKQEDAGPVLATEGVTDAMIAAGNGEEWLTYGGDYDERRFSPLDQINADNVGELGLAWSADLDTARGQEATPLMHDGTLYITTAWSMVKAYDAQTGQVKWEYDPEVPRSKLVEVCCDAVNRGVALYGDKVYVATLDGRLVALDQETGDVVWDKVTIPEGSKMAITGAPRIVKGMVVIGSAGAEYFTRGYIAAFDAQTGNERWRFYTVPGNPADGFENEAMERAAETWSGEWWKLGGGGTVWDAITYDPATDLIYFGTANAEPWNPAYRNTDGAGDSLYTASIVAVKPDTGEYVWHFQETPEDRWDFDSNQQITVTDLNIDGEIRHVVMHAPKNGFFYVLDAETGEFISGKPFVDGINWASGLDPVTGKPFVNPEAEYERTGKPFVGVPGAVGAHSWSPMSYSPTTGLVYIPTNNTPQYYAHDPDWEPGETGFQLGIDVSGGAFPADKAVREEIKSTLNGALVAFDPIAGEVRWKVPQSSPTNGGTLATAGNLVFQGTSTGAFKAYTADTGDELWSFATQTGVLAAPMTYSIDGEQYIAVLAGWGGVWDVSAGGLGGGITPNVSRLLVFKLGAKGELPPLKPTPALVLDPPAPAGTPEQIALGAKFYANSCSVCHGVSAVAGALNPDLRHSSTLGKRDLWQQVVHDGLLAENGMVAWNEEFSREEIEAIRLYVLNRANEDKALEAGGT
ncbi:alcohol dehydrogenase (cytochrome c)/quinohemoprotein ethanol dehydrogenase [Altererythrobacter xiamenensis]|uniref:Alcohol dehydrogenase (Cytochrome c)/quinohemoprotein ethanol dehydrogenase n=1 Tax=Altererythrobacter xiamenensis TaxID=1316679 RepID=A0A1Y6F4I8_9SPHN|nr:PQQ-dependent dehydrogenase, methanol/ethanol family [Altererythrobacter xiamenensis]SMQ69386.1 alcohol dehydrogenase (cytochrome c)/quinohemoprotein ethanol dehydrogenase [Altererythrobacter xiamenensis]